MRRHLLTLAAVAAFAGLVTTVVIVAVSSASGTTGGTLSGGHLPRGGARIRHLPTPPCSFEGLSGPSSVTVSHECVGLLTGAFRCVRSREALALSIRQPLAGGNVFYLTVVIPDFVGPGRYTDSNAFIQIIGPPDPPRWSTREQPTWVDADGSVQLGAVLFLLEAEPGTPATSSIEVNGDAACAIADLGVVRARMH